MTCYPPERGKNPDFGNLTSLGSLLLRENQLSGSVPRELGKLPALTALELSQNEGLSGALPATLTALELGAFSTANTGLCAPADSSFQQWFNAMELYRVQPCGPSVKAYLVQSVQSRDYPVPLVAGRDALLRVFPTVRLLAPPGAGLPVPPVRAKFYAGANEVHSVEIPGKAGPLPARIDEGNLSLSANVLIPGSVLQPGLEMVIEIDPDETLGSALGTGRRIPAEGRTALDIRSMPNMELTVVPFLFASNPDSSILSIVRRMSENPKYSQLHRAHKVLPTNDWNVTAHEAVWTTRGTAEALLRQTRAIRWMEGGRGYWMGVMRPREGFTRGVAYRGGWTSFAEPSVWVIAHELGHNLSLGHAPCGLSDADSYYPHLDGAIGAWGIDLGLPRFHGQLVLWVDCV